MAKILEKTPKNEEKNKRDPNTNRGYGLKHIIEKHGKEIKDSGYKIEEFIPMAVDSIYC